MSIVNRRNAVLGWAVWNVGKRRAKRKAKGVVPSVDLEARRANKPAIVVSALAVVGGALSGLMFWRKKRGETS